MFAARYLADPSRLKSPGTSQSAGAFAGFEDGSLKHVPSASDFLTQLDTRLQNKPFQWRQRASSFAQHLNSLDEPSSPDSSRSSISTPPPPYPGLETVRSGSLADTASGFPRQASEPTPSPQSRAT